MQYKFDCALCQENCLIGNLSCTGYKSLNSDRSNKTAGPEITTTVQDPGDPPATFVDRGSPPTMTAYSPKGTNTDAAVPEVSLGLIKLGVRPTYNCSNTPE